MQNIIHCPVCGRILKTEKTCPGCGYDPARDYEIYPTLGPIPENTASVKAKHLEQEKKTEKSDNANENKGKRSVNPMIMASPIIIACIVIAFVLIIGNTSKQKKNENVDSKNLDTESIDNLIEEESREKNQNIKSTEAVDSEDSEEEQGIESLEVGDILSFGLYEQDNNSDNGKEEIEWIILDKNEKSLLLISKYALDAQPYNTSYTGVTWETCSLREWLNNDFLNTAFTDEEQAIIQEVTVSADKNPSYDTDQGNSTTDQVFLLSISEVKKYFSSDENKKCVPTAYAVEQGAWASDDYKLDGKATCWWWLRSVGYSGSSATGVLIDGFVDANGGSVVDDFVGVRPALWVDLESLIR